MVPLLSNGDGIEIPRDIHQRFVFFSSPCEILARIMVEIDMKKNDAAPFPPRKLFVKNDEFNVKDRVICDPTSNADNLSLF